MAHPVLKNDSQNKFFKGSFPKIDNSIGLGQNVVHIDTTITVTILTLHCAYKSYAKTSVSYLIKNHHIWISVMLPLFSV